MAYGYQTYIPQPYNQAYPQQPQIPQPMQQLQQPVQQMQSNMICRPVAGEEEALGVPTDFSGAVTIMPDFAHGRIYTKSLNFNDGSPIFRVYQMQQPVPPAPPVEYAPLDTVQALAAEIEQLKRALTTERPAKQPKGSAEK